MSVRTKTGLFPHEILLLITMIVVVVGAGMFMSTLMQAKSECLAAGFRGASVDYKLTQYCIKRVQQTDMVIPLSRVRKANPK